jgi:hypothetical protein
VVPPDGRRLLVLDGPVDVVEREVRVLLDALDPLRRRLLTVPVHLDLVHDHEGHRDDDGEDHGADPTEDQGVALALTGPLLGLDGGQARLAVLVLLGSLLVQRVSFVLGRLRRSPRIG